MKEKETINVLDELNKGACMGCDAIFYIEDKVSDDKLKRLLDDYYNKYKDITERITKVYPDSKKNPHKTGTISKISSWYGIEMKLMKDDSTSHIAELLMQGTNMGIIEGRRLLNNNKMDNDTKDILSDFVKMQEEMVERLKEFL